AAQAAQSSTATAAAGTIDGSLLQKTLEEIAHHLHTGFPGLPHARLTQYYSSFVGLIIAMHDGLRVCPYTVKKTILAVYLVLKSLVEPGNVKEKERLLLKSINAALHSLELSKLCSKAQIASIFEAYNQPGAL